MQAFDFKKVLYVGHHPLNRGGIASLEKAYSEYCKPYNHIAIYRQGDIFLKLGSYLRGLFKLLYSLINENQVKIVHIHTASNLDFYRNCIPIFISKLLKKKIVLHIHGGYFYDFCLKHPNVSSWGINKVSRIIVVSDFLLEKLSNLHFIPPIIRVYNFLDQPKPSNTIKSIGPKIRLGYLGAICDNKRIFDLASLFAEHPDLRQWYKFSIAGTGASDKLLDIITNNHLEDSVEYIGWIGGDAKSDFLNAIDIILQPSDYESFGLSLAEAMSYGKIAIATNVGGIPEIITHGENGYLIEKGDFQDLYQILLMIKDNRHIIDEMGARAKDSVKKFYGDQVISELIGLYNNLLIS